MIKGYEDHRGVLEKKYKNIFGEYVFKVNDGSKVVSIKVGKAIYDAYYINSKVTIGHIGKKLINIRCGIVFSENADLWYCPAVEKEITSGLCWEYCYAEVGGPSDTAYELKRWIEITEKFKDIKDFHLVCQNCTHHQ